MFSSRDFSLPESRSMSVINAVNTLVIEPILNPVLAVGGPLSGSIQNIYIIMCVCVCVCVCVYTSIKIIS